MVTHLFTDADNTLWDTNAVFVDAQLGLLRSLERRTGLVAPESHDRGLAFLRGIDQRLAHQHPDHLRYPPAILVGGLLHALRGATPQRATDLALAEAAPTEFDTELEAYLAGIRELPELRSGVRETLSRAAELGIGVTVVSEERQDRCEARIEAHNLSEFVLEVVSATKTVQLFQRLRSGKHDKHQIMVGDQPDRDIVPAQEAGLECYLYPSEFTPFWADRPNAHPVLVINSYDELVPILEQDAMVGSAKA
jgi:putative hydrolase of the HAD superfamily